MLQVNPGLVFEILIIHPFEEFRIEGFRPPRDDILVFLEVVP